MSLMAPCSFEVSRLPLKFPSCVSKISFSSDIIKIGLSCSELSRQCCPLILGTEGAAHLRPQFSSATSLPCPRQWSSRERQFPTLNLDVPTGHSSFCAAEPRTSSWTVRRIFNNFFILSSAALVLPH